ncbi:MAG: hypothetical protein MUF22_02480 [Chitinispirillaceae bacterium]|nr:hypothetical protein [Chitinispirillaceae bacterium]
MNFFLHMHRAILDPSFYRTTAQEFSRRQVVVFIVSLLLFTGLVSGIARTWYLFDARRGIAAPLAKAFSGMEIRSGILYPNRPLPYEPDPQAAAALFGRIFDIPAESANLTMLKVDTAAQTPASDTFPSVILRSRDVLVSMAKNLSFAFAYKEALFGAQDFSFSENAIGEFLKRNLVSILIYSFMVDLFRATGTTLFTLCLLAFGAYLFRADRGQRLGWFVCTASFAITPVPVGIILVALSDVHIPGVWNISVIISFIIMFRAIAYSARPPRKADGEGG